MPRTPKTTSKEPSARGKRGAKKDVEEPKDESGSDVEAGAKDESDGDEEAPPASGSEPAVEGEVVDDDDAFAEPEIADGEDEQQPQSAPLSKPMSATSMERLDPMAAYLREVQRHPLLTPEQTHDLAVKFVESQDPRIAAQLVTANLRLVVIVAREYQRAFHNLLDLIQEGNVGLLEAVKQFDPYRGVRFPSYAVWWIRAYVIRYVMNNFRLVKVGTTQAQRRLFFNLKKEKARLESLGFTPSARQIAESLGVKEKEVIEMDQRLATSSEVSVETPLGHESGGTMLDLLPAPGHSAEEDVSEGEFYALMKEKIEEFGSRLKGREAEIYRERLVAEDPLTLQELGDRYGVSRERVRQMEASVKKKLREFLVSQVRDLDEDMVR